MNDLWFFFLDIKPPLQGQKVLSCKIPAEATFDPKCLDREKNAADPDARTHTYLHVALPTSLDSASSSLSIHRAFAGSLRRVVQLERCTHLVCASCRADLGRTIPLRDPRKGLGLEESSDRGPALHSHRLGRQTSRSDDSSARALKRPGDLTSCSMPSPRTWGGRRAGTCACEHPGQQHFFLCPNTWCQEVPQPAKWTSKSRITVVVVVIVMEVCYTVTYTELLNCFLH